MRSPRRRAIAATAMSRVRCATSAASRSISWDCRRASSCGSMAERSMRRAQHLVIFLRAPQLGRVKSRLARGIGAVPALRFYRNTVDALLRRLARDLRWRTALAVTPDIRLRPWRVAASYRAQGGGDLGERMARVFREVPLGPVIIIGSDI